MTQKPFQLDYVNDVPRLRRRILRMSLGLLAVFLSFLVWKWGAEVLTHARYLAGQRALLRRRLAPDMIAFEMWGMAEEMLRRDGQYRPWPQLRRGRRDCGPVAFYFPQQLAPFLPTPPWIDGLVFLHHRKNADGADRLVAVWVTVRNMDTPLTHDIVVSAAAYEPASLDRAAG